MPSCWLFCSLVLLATPSSAWTTWNTNCSLPPGEPTNFVSSPNTRGTMDIVWSCLLILITCTYTIQHLNVPFYQENAPRKPKWKERLKENWANTTILHWRFMASFHPRYLTGESRWKKLNWMTLAFFFPEYLLGKALAESSSAHHSVQDMTELTTKKGLPPVDWSVNHAFLANMAGMVLRFHVAAVPTDLTPRKPQEDSRRLHILRKDIDPPYEEQDWHEAERIELRQCKEICGIPCSNRPDVVPNTPVQTIARTWALAGIYEGPALRDQRTMSNDVQRVQDPDKADIIERTQSAPVDDEKAFLPPERGPKIDDTQRILGPHKTWKATWALSSAQWHYAYSSGIIRTPHGITKEAISDKSKSDPLVKIIAVAQILWLVIQIIARSIQSLAITLLEITVLAFAACSITTYLFILAKPQDVETPFVVDLPGVLTRRQIIGLAARANPSAIVVRSFFLHGVSIRSMADNIFPPSPYVRFWLSLPFMRTRVINIRINAVLLGIGGGGAIFGAIHATAWNFHFPTDVERTIWRVASLTLVMLVLISTLLYWFTQHFVRTTGRDDTTVALILKYLGYALVPIYVFARSFLLVEVFRSLANPGKSTFVDVDWAAMLPHGG